MENKEKAGDDNKTILILIIIVGVAAVIGGYFLLSGGGGGGETGEEIGGETGQADISVSSISAPSAKVGEDTTISVTVVNSGDASGTEDIDLKIDGETVDTKTASVDAGGEETVPFTIHKSTPGEYTVTALGETTTWTVTEEETGEGGYSGTGTSTYSGTWSGEGPQAEYEGTWEFTVDWETGDVTGLFKGDASGDISGSVSNGEITAEGEAGFGMISWSGSFAADGSEISGTWEDTQLGVYSGTWNGQEGELKEETGGEETEETGGEGSEGSTTTVSSIDITFSGYDAGDFTGGMRFRGRNLDTDSPEWRLDEVDGDIAFIYNGPEEVAYSYAPTENKWVKMTGSMMDQALSTFDPIIENSKQLALSLGEVEEQTITMGDTSVTVSVDMINGSLSNSIFTPPEDATIEEMSTGG